MNRLVATLSAAALCLSACAEIDVFRIRRFEPVPVEKTAPLSKQNADLQTCLDTLGAPVLVWESPRGMVLAYAWLDKLYWKVDVQAWGVDDLQGQTLLSYKTTNNAYEGAVLVFDEALRLQFVRHGLLADITRDLQRRPAYID